MLIRQQQITYPLISIIVPVYGVVEYLDQCVQSLVSQTYQNLEIILVDDGSPDKCGVMCDAWSKRDSRVLTIHTQNHGVSHARNVGLDNASGEYIGFVDSDDWIDEDMYEIMIREMLTNGTDICGGGYIREGIYSGNLSLRKETAQVLDRNTAILEIYSTNNQHLLFWELCDKLFRRNVIGNLRIEEHIYNHEDKLFFWQVMKNVTCVSYLPLFRYHYRMRVDSMTHSFFSKRRLSFFEAEFKLWELSKNEMPLLRNLMSHHYNIALYEYIKELFIVDYLFYKDEILQKQALLRKKAFSIFFIGKFTMRQRIGVLYLCLPYRLCVKLLRLIFPASIKGS